MRKASIFPWLFVFTLSGFSGLIYESIWTHYLKLFLGHAAYAQSLVLGIFMGGLALGSWLCARNSVRWARLLSAYALVEGLIGLMALAFHTLFDQSIQFSYASVLPHLGSPALAYAYKWGLSALLILPQSILLGMTFPLMSAGIVRRFPEQPGRVISLLYFTNSLGAAIGVLTSGFLLIRLVGLPWTIRIAGLVNIAVALMVFAMVRDQERPAAKVAPKDMETPRPQDGPYRILLLVSLITGASSFMYEIGWIRMLSLVLGSSTHSFELMLSAFILGLACGGFWIQRVIERITLPERYLGFVQVAMGFFALSTLLVYSQTFSVMKWLIQNLEKTSSGYLAFNLAGNGIALAIMLPTTFCAGMTLPLITAILIKRKHGESSIGAVYATNTLGAIIGVFLAIHVGLPALGLKGLIILAASLDVVLGVYLLWRHARQEARLPWLWATVAWGCALPVLIFGIRFDPYKMASGVYRTGMFLYPQLMEINSHEDGKTATITTYSERSSGVMAIATNGKSDAALALDLNSQATPDESTMILLGSLPMAIHPTAKRVANIGLGSGLTTQTLLGNPGLLAVDTIEIEKAVVDAGKAFLPRVQRVYRDPRSRIVLDDAKTYFSAQQEAYDIILSEPSNPWVSGVSGLFSQEFYELVNHHLEPEGVFVQWVQLYEIDSDLVLSILKTISESFSDYVVYSTNDRDLVIVAKKQGQIPALSPGLFLMPEVSAALRRIHIQSMQDLAIRRIGSKRLFKRMLEAPAIQANSDYFPVLDQQAVQARFMGVNAFEFTGLLNSTAPLVEMLGGFAPGEGTTQVTLAPHLTQSLIEQRARAMRDICLRGHSDDSEGIPPEVPDQMRKLVALFQGPTPELSPGGRQAALYNSLIAMVPYLNPQEMDAVWSKLESSKGTTTLSWPERNWVTFFKAISRRDARAMAAGANTILVSRQPLPPVVMEYVVATGMTGLLVQGDREGARRLWTGIRSSVLKGGTPDLFFRLLMAESETT